MAGAVARDAAGAVPQIGQLKVELEWLKKITVTPVVLKREEIEPEHLMIPIYRQGELLSLACSSLYFKPSGEEGRNLGLMRLIDEQFTRTPF